jgi:hypothetical protein
MHVNQYSTGNNEQKRKKYNAVISADGPVKTSTTFNNKRSFFRLWCFQSSSIPGNERNNMPTTINNIPNAIIVYQNERQPYHA